MAVEQAEEIMRAITAVASSGTAALGLGWWLSGRFRKVEIKTEETIAKHELVDERRHMQNIEALEKIRLALAKAGMWNGK